jgi:hypothetical protein
MNWKGYGRNWLWSVLKYSIPATALRDSNKSQKIPVKRAGVANEI